MLTLHLSWSFLTLPSITCHSSTLLGVTLLTHFQSNAFSSLVCQIFGSTIYLVSQIASLARVEISYFSSVNIDAICVSSQPSSVYFSWTLGKNYWRSSIDYHLFVNSAMFFVCDSFQDGGAKHSCDDLIVLAGCSCVFVWAF